MTLHGRPYQPPGLKHFDPATISWSVGGRAVVLNFESFEATAPGGYGQLQATAKPEKGRRRRMKQGDRVIGRKPNGDVVYEGRLQAPPKYVDDVAYFTAMGPRTEIDGFNDRLPYQIRDASQWHELHSDPAQFTGSEKFQIAQKGNTLGVVAQNGQSYSSGDHQGYYLWVQGWEIQVVKFTQQQSTTNANFDLRTRRSDDSFTSPTTVDTWSMGSGSGTARTSTFTASASIAVIDWNANGTATPANNNRFWVQNARAGIITTQDVFSSSEVAQDVGTRCGYEVDAVGATNMMPLDWASPATDLMDYLADIEDQTWLVMDSNQKSTYGKLYFRPWGHKVWHTSLNNGWAEDQGLQPVPLYNRVTTTYQNPPGVQQSVRSSPDDFGLTDPLPGRQEDYPEILQLEDPQPDNSLALAVNAKALQKLTKLRLKGNLNVTYTQKGVPFDIWPGDTIKIGGFQPDIPPQRIAAVSYQKDGTVQLSIGIDYNLAALVDKRITRHLKRRNRRRS